MLINESCFLANTFSGGPGGASGSSANAATQNFQAGGLGGGFNAGSANAGGN